MYKRILENKLETVFPNIVILRIYFCPMILIALAKGPSQYYNIG